MKKKKGNVKFIANIGSHGYIAVLHAYINSNCMQTALRILFSRFDLVGPHQWSVAEYEFSYVLVGGLHSKAKVHPPHHSLMPIVLAAGSSGRCPGVVASLPRAGSYHSLSAITSFPLLKTWSNQPSSCKTDSAANH